MILSPLSASDELQMTAREVKDTSSDSLSATLTLRTFFGWITFSFFVHLHHSLIPFLPSASSPFPCLHQRWKRGQALWSELVMLQRWGWDGQSRRALDGFPAALTVMLSKQHLLEQGRALCSAITCLQTAATKGTQHWNVSYQEMLLLSSSLSITKPASRLEQGLLGASSSLFVFLQVVHLLLQSSCFS